MEARRRTRRQHDAVRRPRAASSGVIDETLVLQRSIHRGDPTLTIDTLDTVGSKLKNLPTGWTFETKVLTEDLVLDTAEADGWASMLRDEVGCTYQACGYDSDTSANYIP